MKGWSIGARRAMIAAICVVAVFALLFLLANVPVAKSGIDSLIETLRFGDGGMKPPMLTKGLTADEAAYLQRMEELFRNRDFDLLDQNYALALIKETNRGSDVLKIRDRSEAGFTKYTAYSNDGSTTVLRFNDARELLSVEIYDVEDNLIRTTDFR
jgi:uncharacterized protein (DUF1684 family)